MNFKKPTKKTPLLIEFSNIIGQAHYNSHHSEVVIISFYIFS